MELTDSALITKADGELAGAAGRAAADCANALRLMRPRSAQWTPVARTCSAREGRGIAEAWQLMQDFERRMRASGALDARRTEQSRAWMWSEVTDQLLAALRDDPGARALLPELEARVRDGTLPAAAAAGRLVARFLERRPAARASERRGPGDPPDGRGVADAPDRRDVADAPPDDVRTARGHRG